jgi:hypothetical protein
VDRKNLQTLSRVRVTEARALLNAGLNDGAYYLAGYAVECALKACIAKETRRYEFPDKKRVLDSYTHNLKELVGLAKLEESRRERARKDPAFEDNWKVVQDWSELSRYQRYGPDAAMLTPWLRPSTTELMG